MGREKYNSKVYEPAQQKAKKTKGKKSQAPTDFEKAMEQSTPQNRRDLMKGISESYGKESKYLLRQAGVSSSFQERNPAQWTIDFAKILDGFRKISVLLNAQK